MTEVKGLSENTECLLLFISITILLLGLPVERRITSFTRLSGIIPCLFLHIVIFFLLYASFLPCSVSVFLCCPFMTRGSSVCHPWALVCAVCPAKQVVAAAAIPSVEVMLQVCFLLTAICFHRNCSNFLSLDSCS